MKTILWPRRAVTHSLHTSNNICIFAATMAKSGEERERSGMKEMNLCRVCIIMRWNEDNGNRLLRLCGCDVCILER